MQKRKKLRILMSVVSMFLSISCLSVKAAEGDISKTEKNDGINDLVYTINGTQYTEYVTENRMYTIHVSLAKGQDLVIQGDLEGDAEKVVGTVNVTVNYHTEQVSKIEAYPNYDFENNVFLKDRIVDGIAVKDTIGWAARPASLYDKGILYSCAVTKPTHEPIQNLTSYTITPSQAAIEAGEMDVLLVNEILEGATGSVNSTANRKFKIIVTFTDAPVKTPLKAPTLTLESDADNGGLKYTVTDNENGGKASGYAIDLFSDNTCNSQVGSTINVATNALSRNIPLSEVIKADTTYYAKVKAIGDDTNYSDSPLSSIAVSAVASAVTPSKTEVTWTSAQADGEANTTTSTKIDIVFNKSVTGLTEGNFSLDGADIIALNGSENKYSLSISNAVKEGNVSLSITSPEGYTITPSSQNVSLHKVADPINAELKTVIADGADKTTTTKLTLTFDKDINGLTAENIQLSGVDGIKKGSLIKEDGTGVYTLAINDFTAGGTLNVSVSGVSGYTITGSKTVVIYHYTEPTPTEKFTVNYDLADGKGSFPDQNAELNDDVKIYSYTPVKEGYKFTGWKISGTSTIKQPNETITSDTQQTITLIAQWTKDDIELSFNASANGTANKADTTTITVIFDKEVTSLTKNSFSLTNATITEISNSGKTYYLTLSNVTQEGEAILEVTAPQGYTIKEAQKKITLHKDTRTNVTFNGVNADGTKNQGSTLKLTLNFDTAIRLTTDNIRIIDVDGTGATKGTFVQKETSYELTLNNLGKSGRIKVEIINVPEEYVLTGNNKEVNVIYVTDSKKPETVSFYDQVINNEAQFNLKDNILNKGDYSKIEYAWYESDDNLNIGNLKCKSETCSVTLKDVEKYYTLKVKVTEGDNKKTEYTVGQIKITANSDEKYVVSFELNGGTGKFESISQSIGSSILLNGTEPTRTNYTFTGWKDNKGNTIAKNGTINSPESAETLILTAQWKAKETGGNGGNGGGFSGGGSSKNEGWKEEKDGVYYYENGKIVTGFKDIESKTYYFDNAGKMVTGFNNIKNKTYYFDTKGVMKKASWFEESKKHYYAYEDGVIAKGWLPIEKEWYYMNPTDGHMVKDWVKDEESWYFMGPEGNMWRQHWAPGNNGNWYYVDIDGKMIYDTWIPSHSGYWYYIGSDGRMVTNAMVDGCWINSLGIYHSPTYQG